ncbi:HTH domain protein [Sporotomaculum syntrophicum]|uniref:HTH domain protein n=1 Tax=Sporotomaculum syntrophicum TaxID=182264 RepID=A0A9D2WP43_9FIRM|nr:HTH domain protein [Sporotomaculum syntrophicum]
MTGEEFKPDQIIRKNNTLICLGLTPQENSCIKSIAHKHRLKVVDTDIYSDLFALPSLCVILNPNTLSQEELKTLIDFWNETNESCFSVFFSCQPKNLLPARLNTRFICTLNDIVANNSVLELKVVRHIKRINREIKQSKIYEAKIVRLLGILKILNQNKFVKTMDLVKKYKVSARTIQRDISLLERTGEPIFYDQAKRAYSLLGQENIYWGND